MLRISNYAPALLAIASVCCTGCRISTHKNGNKNNVDIGTPFGSMQVRTDDRAGNVQTGITPYPGATLVKKDNDDNGAADISMNFGDWKLGVHAVDLRTADAPDKVLSFYRKDLARYGDVLTCKGKAAIGTPERTREGLTCGSDRTHVELGTTDRIELRAGSENHQHIVGVHSEDGATRIGLVALDLPGGFRHHDESDRE